MGCFFITLAQSRLLSQCIECLEILDEIIRMGGERGEVLGDMPSKG